MIDKSWIGKPRTDPEYYVGVNAFLDFAFAKSSERNKIKCPCSSCGFKKSLSRGDALDHLVLKGFPIGYTTWVRHGENILDTTSHFPVKENVEQLENSMQNVVQGDVCVDFENIIIDELRPLHQSETQATNDKESTRFQEFIMDGNQQLYEGCMKYTKLSFLLKLYHIKCLCKVSDKAMGMILELLKDAFENANMPESFYEGKKIINKLGLNYEKIHACPNDCMIYWGNDANLEHCRTCQTSRWKVNKKELGNNVTRSNKKKSKRPANVLRYFPLKHRLQRLFMSSKTAEHMRWHVENRSSDSMLRHPRYGESWKSFDALYPEFAADPRNVRLALATDGFNPFGIMSTNISIWPVMLIPYNLPPWMCMKQTSVILYMIIPGKKMPGNDIDVYLQPLIKELLDLWIDGVQTFDASKDETFNMRAALLWTISDFPGLDNLSGWNTKTGLACPSCNYDFKPQRLQHGRKWCFMGHLRFLKPQHTFRFKRSLFDGTIERRGPPIPLSGADVLSQIEHLNVIFGKDPNSRKSKKMSRQNVNEGEKTMEKEKYFLQIAILG